MKPAGDMLGKIRGPMSTIYNRAMLGLVILCVGMCAVVVWSNINARVIPDKDAPKFYLGPTFPMGIVAGHDFWITYSYSRILTQGYNANRLPENVSQTLKNYFIGPRGVTAYPPFVFALYAPYTLLPYPSAYSIHAGVLFLANLLAVWLACRMFARGILRHLGGEGVTGMAGNGMVEFLMVAVFGLVSLVNVASYGYLFSVERGNSDAIAICLVTLFLYVLINKPDWIWTQVILLSMAIHLKVTPVLFCSILLWRYGWKCIVQLCLTNVFFLMIMGLGNAEIFIRGILQFNANPGGWWGDHSSYSFADTVLRPLGYSLSLSKTVISWGALVLWATAFIVLWRRGLTGVNVLLVYCVSVPVMMVFPSSSNDYKLVMLAGPIAVILGGFLCNFVLFARWGAVAGAILTMSLLLPIMTSGGLFHSLLFVNKCPSIIAFMLIVMWAVVRPQGVFDSSVVRSVAIQSAEIPETNRSSRKKNRR